MLQNLKALETIIINESEPLLGILNTNRKIRNMHKRLEFNLFTQRFPRDIAEDYELDEGESATRPPLNFGEAVVVLPGTGGNADQVSRFF
jgi:hypothetical protein